MKEEIKRILMTLVIILAIAVMISMNQIDGNLDEKDINQTEINQIKEDDNIIKKEVNKLPTQSIETFEMKEIDQNYIQELIDINKQYSEDDVITVEGLDIQERYVRIFMSGGRTEEEAIQLLLKSKKRGIAFEAISNNYDYVAPSEEEIEEMKVLLLPPEDAEDIERILLVQNATSYEEYYNNENNYKYAKNTLIRNQIIEIKKRRIEEENPDMSFGEVRQKAFDELNEEMSNYVQYNFD